MQQPLSIESELQDLELSLLQPTVRKSARVSELLAEGFIEFGSSGRVFTKEQAVASLRSESTTLFTVTQFKVQWLASHIALVTYRVSRDAEQPSHSLRSSIWERRQERWRMIFHQGTLTAEFE
jgi:hypothetical protein